MKLERDLIQNYLIRRKKELDLCYSLLLSSDFHELLRIGHQLKGNGSMYGFPELSLLGNRLEKAASESDLSRSSECVLEYQKILNNAFIESF